MGNNKVAIWVFFGMAAAAITILLISMPKAKEAPSIKINSFEDCAKAGLPVMESYPRQCKSADGKLFIEKLVQVECGSDAQCKKGQVCKNHVCR
jgi:hypothetical protein